MSGEKNYPELFFNGPLNIYNADYVDDYKFLITQFSTNFNEYDKATYGQILYLDAFIDRPARLVGQGMMVSFTKTINLNSENLLSHVTVIVRA